MVWVGGNLKGVWSQPHYHCTSRPGGSKPHAACLLPGMGQSIASLGNLVQSVATSTVKDSVHTEMDSLLCMLYIIALDSDVSSTVKY